MTCFQARLRLFPVTRAALPENGYNPGMAPLELTDAETRLILRLRSLRHAGDFDVVAIALRPLTIIEKISRRVEPVELPNVKVAALPILSGTGAAS